MNLVRSLLTPTIRMALLLSVAAPLFGAPASNPPPPEPETLDLKTAIGYALENNFAIRQARERIRQQEGVVIEVKAQALPNLGADGYYQFNELEFSPGNPPS